MAEAKAQGKDEQDPSMEEILQSIRRIIAEDDKPGAIAAEPENLGSDVLELTDALPEEPMSEPTNGAAPVDVLANIDSALAPEAPKEAPKPEVAAAPPPPPAPPAAAEAPPPPPAPPKEGQLLSDEAKAAASAALKKLTEVKPPEPAPATPSMPFKNGDTVEDLAMNALKPMIKEWLDTNLPALVERIVEREVKKLRD